MSDHFVYRAVDAAGRVLYIGQTSNLTVRLRHHMNCSAWWRHAASLTWETFESRQSAVEAEAAAIRAEKPPYNVMHNPDFDPAFLEMEREAHTRLVRAEFARRFPDAAVFEPEERESA